MKMANWTKDNIASQQGKVIVITGANTGLGKSCSSVLAEKGAHVVLACRSENNAQDTMKEILEANAKAKLTFIPLDLQSLASIEKFAKTFKEQFKTLDVLMNNAGIMNVPYGLTFDDNELQFATNHLGHFALTGHLLDCLKQTENSRVVTVSSLAHKTGRMNFDNLQFENRKGYTPIKAYSRSKLANLLFAYELQRRFIKHQIKCISVAAHPGTSKTDLGRHIEDALFFKVFNPVLEKIVQDADMGALPQLRAAVDPDIWAGGFYGPSDWFGTRGYPVYVQSSWASRSIKDAQKLWEVSEQITGVTFQF